MGAFPAEGTLDAAESAARRRQLIMAFSGPYGYHNGTGSKTFFP